MKSWYFALAGIVIQAGLGILLLLGARAAHSLGEIVFIFVFAPVLLLGSTIGIIPLLFLLFKRTRTFGGILSLIFGIAGIVIGAGLIVGFFLLVAGISALWKKN